MLEKNLVSFKSTSFCLKLTLFLSKINSPSNRLDLTQFEFEFESIRLDPIEDLTQFSSN